MEKAATNFPRTCMAIMGRKREHNLERVGVGEKEFVRGDAPVEPAPCEGRGQGHLATLVMGHRNAVQRRGRLAGRPLADLVEDPARNLQ